jgi:hypothetical protein
VTIDHGSFGKEVAMADARATGTKGAVHKNGLDFSDETRPFGKGKAEIVNVDGVTIVRLNYFKGAPQN